RGMMKVWNVWLIFITFLLSLFGTFLTRSGVVSSVHAFAQSDIGTWFVWFMVLVLGVCLWFFIMNRDHLKSENQLQSMVSRESSFLFNNLLLLVSCFAVLWGTLFPILSEWVQGNKVTVGPPFFNKVNVPIGLFLLFLTGIGPLLAWRSSSFESIKRNFAIPTGVALLAGIALIVGGMRFWVADDMSQFYSWMAIVLGVFVFATITSEFYRGGKVIAGSTGMNLLSAIIQLTRRNTRRYGGYIVHYGVVVICIGFAGAAFNQTNERELGFQESMSLGPYTLVCQKYTQDDTPNYSTELAIIDVFKNGKRVTTLFPERRFYKANQQPSTMVANYSTIREDVYLVYAGRNTDSDKPIIKAHLNPLVSWIWAGVIIIVIGTFIALVPNLPAALAKPRIPAASATAQKQPERNPVEVGD
ncbi:MAG TPA: cytochrome c-type biogenesis CcmF C-terminal domain-containing protein, partial [Terriglobales bacterium]|nr:cytochrome c-type biogenesis CcmF C-terminal domain-containing protein [Terriglobales bacterium]